MIKVLVVALCVLSASFSGAQAKQQKQLHFDLSKVGMVLDGEQICNDTNSRLQDIPSATMDQITAAGTQSVPVLIRMLADTHMARTKEPIFCYWPGMSISDIAFCLLTGLFQDIKGRTTVPGAGWTDILGPANASSWEQLHSFVKKNGVAALQAKWWRLWKKYGSQMEWDPKERCIKLKA